MKNDPLRPEFWKAYAKERDGAQEGRFSSPEFWDKIAEGYDDLEQSPFYREMVEEILSTMRQRGALAPQARVLDVCCGPGNYALRFAPLVKEVVGIDISPKMLAKFREKARQKGLQNVKILLQDWYTFEAQETFHTVFVSMTPVLHDLDSIDRLLALAREFLVLVHWAGVRKNLLYARIWKEIFGREWKWGRPGIIVPFNYLYTLGYAGDLRFFTGYWERRRPLEKELDHLLWRASHEGIQVDKEAREKIKQLLQAEAVDGQVYSRTKVRIGFLLVHIPQRAQPT